MFYAPRFLVISALISCLKRAPGGRSKYERTMHLRRRVRRVR